MQLDIGHQRRHVRSDPEQRGRPSQITIRLRTREGMAVARSRGKLRGKQPKLSDKQQKELRRMHDTGEYAISDLAELFSVSRPTVYRTLGRQAPAI